VLAEGEDVGFAEPAGEAILREIVDLLVAEEDRAVVEQGAVDLFVDRIVMGRARSTPRTSAPQFAVSGRISIEMADFVMSADYRCHRRTSRRGKPCSTEPRC